MLIGRRRASHDARRDDVASDDPPGPARRTRMPRSSLVSLAVVVCAVAPALQSARAPQPSSGGCHIQSEFRKSMARPRSAILLALRQPGNLAALKAALPKAEGALLLGQFPGCENDWQVIDARLDLAYMKQVIAMLPEERAALERAERLKDRASGLFEQARYRGGRRALHDRRLQH